MATADVNRGAVEDIGGMTPEELRRNVQDWEQYEGLSLVVTHEGTI